jgi:hypothetical protein
LNSSASSASSDSNSNGTPARGHGATPIAIASANANASPRVPADAPVNAMDQAMVNASADRLSGAEPVAAEPVAAEPVAAEATSPSGAHGEERRSPPTAES